MFYIKTTRGWRLLHKRNYEIANSWQKDGRDIEETVAKLRKEDYWVTERNFNYWIVMDRLINSARRRAEERSIKFNISFSDIKIPDVCPLRCVPFRVGASHHTDDSPTLDRKDPRLGYVKGNVWVISHKANRLKGSFTPDELRTFCENVLALDWVTWTSDDDEALRRQQAELKRKTNEKHKPRWWTLWGQNPK